MNDDEKEMDDAEKKKAFTRGYDACICGFSYYGNPYNPISDKRSLIWRDGWDAAAQDLIEAEDTEKGVKDERD